MNKFLIILLLTLVACEQDVDAIMFKNFQKFIKKYNKKYNSLKEYIARFHVFKSNVISALQEKQSYSTGITKFSDMTFQEFSKIYLNLKYDAIGAANFNPFKVKPSNAAPVSWDWRDSGCVPSVKDQGSCGACWAFVAGDLLEFLYCRHHKSLVPLSQQMMIDCDTSDSGCNGGLMEYAFAWLKKNGGIMKETDYPYKGYKGTCKSDVSKYIDMTITGYKKLGSSSSIYSPVDEDEIKEFLYETGILGVAINANPLQTYTGGIVDKTSSQCPSSGINHSVVLVGYGHDTTLNKDYWLLKNSWGKSWGESGYFRLKRGSGVCGVNTYVITPTVSF